MEKINIEFNDSSKTTLEQPNSAAPEYSSPQTHAPNGETPYVPSAQPVGQNYSINFQPMPQPIPQPILYPQYVVRPLFGKYPQPITCPNCHASALSNVKLETGLATYLATGVGCLFCACLGLIACCIDDLKDAEHYCSNCGTLVGVRKVVN